MVKEQSDWIQKIRILDPALQPEFLAGMKPYQLETIFHMLARGCVATAVTVDGRHELKWTYIAG